MLRVSIWMSSIRPSTDGIVRGNGLFLQGVGAPVAVLFGSRCSLRSCCIPMAGPWQRMPMMVWARSAVITKAQGPGWDL